MVHPRRRLRIAASSYRNPLKQQETPNAGEATAASADAPETRAGQLERRAPSSASRTTAAGTRPEGDQQLEGSEAPTADSPKTEVMESLSDAEFSLAVEVTYHGARQAFFEGAHRWMMFLTIVLVATAVTPIASEKVFAFFAAVVAATDIAFDLTGRAQKHADLRRRYYDLAADVAKHGAENADFARRWMLISADEPPTKVWVDQIARWNTCAAMEREAGERPPLWKRAIAHFALV